MRAWLPSLPSDARRGFSLRLMSQATHVARSSGGWLGLGRICEAEEQLLIAMQRVLGLRI